MKRQLHEKSKVVNKVSPSFSPQDSIRASARDQKPSVNGEYGSRIPEAALAAGGPLDETQMDDMQAANCVIS